MEYTKLGRTGLDMWRICLGCMSYGEGDQGSHAWSLGEEESRPFIKRALEAGINFFDTANRCSLGSSEEILGREIKDFARRDEVVIATKEKNMGVRSVEAVRRKLRALAATARDAGATEKNMPLGRPQKPA